MKSTNLSVILLLLATLGGIKANEETPYPLGASDLAPDKRFEEFRTKETKIESSENRIDFEAIEFPEEFEESSIGEFLFKANQLTISAIKKENEELKSRVTELEERIARLEETITKTGDLARFTEKK